MILDYNDLSSDHLFDFCVIGSGPAGISLARKLATRDHRIALLEGGDKVYTSSSQDLYKGSVIGDNYVPLEATRMRFLGGSSNCWGGRCRPLDPEDYIAKPNYPLCEWPIRKADLDPYLKEAYRVLDLTNPGSDVEFEKGGIKNIVFSLSNPTTMFGRKYSEELRNSSRIHLFLKTNLTSLETADGRITAANTINFDNKRSKIRAKHYILAMGGIENSRLLLWSNELGNGQVVKNDRTLGKYWMEHPHFLIGDALIDSEHPFNLSQTGDICFSPSWETMVSENILNCGLIVEPGENYHGTKKLIKDLACVAPSAGIWAAKLFGKNLICDAVVRAAWEQEPSIDNRIELSDELDQLGVPRTRLHWRMTETDMRTVLQTAMALGRFLADRNIGRLRVLDWVRGLEAPPVNDEIAGNHHMGGTRMATTPEMGIVDSNCQVYGQQNLFIAGSSVFPGGGHANPTLTIVQLALRLGEHLLKAV